MQAGREPETMKRCCIANKKGFVSAYALALLCIILSFVGLCAAQVQLCAVLLKQNKQHEIELYVIHHIKSQLQQIRETQEKKEREGIEQGEVQSEPVEEKDSEELVSYHHTTIKIIYEDAQVAAIYACNKQMYTMTIQLDEQKEIMDIAYS